MHDADVRVIAVTVTGFFYEYTVVALDAASGPQCTLELETNLLDRYGP